MLTRPRINGHHNPVNNLLITQEMLPEALARAVGFHSLGRAN
jgi:hypothetical protein